MATSALAVSDLVLNHYSSIAREDSTSNVEHIKKVAKSFGYSAEDLAAIPDGANLGLSCGNPLAIAGIKLGETVIDLGSGGGFDVFQAAHKVGAAGRSIGIDSSIDMITRAKANAAKVSIANVSFILAPITSIPLSDESADCIISNCVVNLLSPSEKPVCFQEIYRLLKPGGRLAISDVLAKKLMSTEMQADMGLYVGCISGASLVHEYENWLRIAGFEDIILVDKHVDLNIYKERDADKTSDCCGGTALVSSCCAQTIPTAFEHQTAENRMANIDFNEWVGSHNVCALKPKKA